MIVPLPRRTPHDWVLVERLDTLADAERHWWRYVAPLEFRVAA